VKEMFKYRFYNEIGVNDDLGRPLKELKVKIFITTDNVKHEDVGVLLKNVTGEMFGIMKEDDMGNDFEELNKMFEEEGGEAYGKQF